MKFRTILKILIYNAKNIKLILLNVQLHIVFVKINKENYNVDLIFLKIILNLHILILNQKKCNRNILKMNNKMMNKSLYISFLK